MRRTRDFDIGSAATALTSGPSAMKQAYSHFKRNWMEI
jgi:hypothetical protein